MTMINQLATVAAALMLAACATTTQQAQQGGSAMLQRPASDRPVTSEAQGKAKIHADLSMAYLSARRFGVALDEARMALAYDNDYAPAHHANALVLMALEDAESARLSFERAASLAPGDPEINNSYGWYLCTRGDYENGIARLERAVRNPYYLTPTRPLTNIGLCELARKNEDAADAAFRRALQADNNNRQALLNLAAIAYRRGNLAAAHAHLNTAHQRGEPSAASLWLGVRVERARGNRDGEGSYASQLRRLFPTSREYEMMIEGNYQ